MDKIVAFPIMGNYYIPSKYLFSRIIEKNSIILSSKISDKTIELGGKYSPEFVCTPFKYTLGTFIECLELGANILIQMGGGCRYGYYYELQEKILNDLGYNFSYYNLVSEGHTDIKKIIKIMKEINPKFNIVKGLYYLLITIRMTKCMDKMEDYIRKNVGYEIVKGEFNAKFQDMLNKFSNVKSYLHLRIVYARYKRKIKKTKVNKPKKNIKVGIIGELYTLMEPFANHNIETLLSSYGVEIKRFTNVTYLLFEKRAKSKKYLKKLKNIKYKMGADAMDNIYYTKYLIDNKYDGIIHIKSSFCTPEIGAMSIINKMCEENDMPLLCMSFDINTTSVGLETRLEAFYDMIEMRKRCE